MKKFEKYGITWPKLILTVVFCLFGLLSIIYVRFTTNTMFSYFYCLATVPFAALPLIISLCFGWKINFAFYTFFSLYTIGPLLGAVYNLYYYTTWWDDLLHAMAGAIFAVVGAYLVVTLNKSGKVTYLISGLFGLLFSISIAVIWEFYEFGSDILLGSDMQSDTIINAFATKINRTDGGVTTFDNISNVIVNGQNLGINGYLDIGLFDTMNDMFVETLGALIYFIYAVIDRGRHPLILRIDKKKK